MKVILPPAIMSSSITASRERSFHAPSRATSESR